MAKTFFKSFLLTVFICAFFLNLLYKVNSASVEDQSNPTNSPNSTTNQTENKTITIAPPSTATKSPTKIQNITGDDGLKNSTGEKTSKPTPYLNPTEEVKSDNGMSSTTPNPPNSTENSSNSTVSDVTTTSTTIQLNISSTPDSSTTEKGTSASTTHQSVSSSTPKNSPTSNPMGPTYLTTNAENGNSNSSTTTTSTPLKIIPTANDENNSISASSILLVLIIILAAVITFRYRQNIWKLFKRYNYRYFAYVKFQNVDEEESISLATYSTSS